ncbi:urate hydroxylase PuuD [Xanthobacter oligotrophicus]|uniref:urate hydroxylase PuuD n=1 Tax=Xanthobacter oligotrophicus TaxID=2607286 RepID=UPI0011F19A9B|nr:urate hydroxylase PuuD [Xanthobacter oligotrophicus]MCG5235845.1 urate hydroxylase PuuD [Xanthobacter oligotrophicus]
MEPILHEWGSLLLRWTHIIAGMAWIGSSFYFMHLDASLKATPDIPAGKGGEAWEVHGGGFYQVKKYLVAPSFLPEELGWHKWQSYATWLTGFFLLIWIYYYKSSIYLIDPAVMNLKPFVAFVIGMGGLALGWVAYDQLCRSRLGNNPMAVGVIVFVGVVLAAYLFQQVFSARAAFIHTGALMATIMSGNVFFVIIPNQHKVVAALKAGQVPDPYYGKTAKLRSGHNNYFTLPVVFLMISNHYPLTYSTPYAYVIVALSLVVGTVIRYYYNERHAGRGDKAWCWLVAAVCLILAIAISATTTPMGRTALGLPPLVSVAYARSGPPVEVPDDVANIVMGRCSMCHASEPLYEGIVIAPRGVLLDTPEHIARNRDLIVVQAGLTHAMPPNNITELSQEDREVLKAWGAGK